VYHCIAAWFVIQFGRHEITREVTDCGVVCGKEIGHTVQKTFRQNVPQDNKIETIDTNWVQGKVTRSAFYPSETQTCLVKISETYQISSFAVRVKSSCSANCESDFFSTNHFSQCAVLLLQVSGRRADRSNTHKDAVQSEGLLPPAGYSVKRWDFHCRWSTGTMLLRPFVRILRAFAKLLKKTISFIMSVCLPSCSPVCMEQLGSIGWIFMKFYIWVFLQNLSRKFKLHSNLRRITSNLHENEYNFWSYFDHFFLEWEIFQTNVLLEVNTRI